MLGRSTKLGLMLGAVVAVMVGGMAALDVLNGESAPAPAPVTRAGSAAQTAPGSGDVAPPTTGSQPTAQAAGGVPRPPGPPAAAHGDSYAHNVKPGTPCARAGARGFTADVTLMRCTTTTADSRLRWRKG